MARVDTHVDIYPAAIQTHFIAPAGEVARDAEAVGRVAVRRARGFAGRRSGALERGISYGRDAHFGRYRYTITMVSTAKHTVWVNDGTLDKIIRAKRPIRRGADGKVISGGMHLPPYGRHTAKILDEVRGQYPKKFLQRGMSAALKTRGYPGVF